MRQIEDHDGDYVKVRREKDGITVEAHQEDEYEQDYAIVGPVNPKHLIEAIYEEMGWSLPPDVRLSKMMEEIRQGEDS